MPRRGAFDIPHGSPTRWNGITAIMVTADDKVTPVWPGQAGRSV